jgi:hypothetical protein
MGMIGLFFIGRFCVMDSGGSIVEGGLGTPLLTSWRSEDVHGRTGYRVHNCKSSVFIQVVNTNCTSTFSIPFQLVSPPSQLAKFKKPLRRSSCLLCPRARLADSPPSLFGLVRTLPVDPQDASSSASRNRVQIITHDIILCMV